jgi:ABC-2 type transport system permease protein
MMINMVIDSFAGERERHTLETLLASRLSDRAILLGKIFSAVIYGMGATIMFLAMGLAVVNVAFWDGHVMMFEPDILMLVLLAALTIYLLLAVMGILISIKAPTVRVGNDALIGGLIAVAAAIFILYSILPEGWKAGIAIMAFSAGKTNLEIALAIALVAVCLAGLYVAARLFRRSELFLF